ncbi:MAG: hypothetical protein CSB44_11775 [Gammaproteobacteria bacterium]|nr:MAG: hypothetical protein CSB44_11775 [Gammaproteobacteria bacterium]
MKSECLRRVCAVALVSLFAAGVQADELKPKVEIAAANSEYPNRRGPELNREMLTGEGAAARVLTYDDSAAVDLCRQPGRRELDAILPIATDHGSFASGVVLDRDRVLTAAHAVQGADRFFVRVRGEYRRARLVLVDHQWDLAVLRVGTGNIRPLPLAMGEPVAEQRVWAAGFPRASAMTMTEGVLQENLAGALHTSASIDTGQSGGGLLSCANGEWQITGMLRGFGAYLEGDHYIKLENHSVSVSADQIQRFLASSDAW